jgi:CHASE2 domain-containing sensor protein
MEAHEVQEFANQMKESAEGEGGRESLKTISLAISILAVLVALVTVLGHRSHTEAILMQSRAADQWNEYQAQKIRMSNLVVTVDQMDLQPSLSAAAAAKRDEYKAHVEKWKNDLANDMEKAEHFEHGVEYAEAKAIRYDLGEALLQIAVVLCSVTLFTRKHSYFMFGLAIGVAGMLGAGSALLVH